MIIAFVSVVCSVIALAMLTSTHESYDDKVVQQDTSDKIIESKID